MLSVSVIIPVYNAEKYVRRAVESAVNQQEVQEVILVEDGSPDSGLEICKQLEGEYETVKLFQHFDKGNHGAGASRNLGISNSTCDYVAFLDADDFYLPNRFKTASIVFENNPDADGVYESVGTHFEDEIGKARYNKEGYSQEVLTTIESGISPEELFEAMAPIGKKGFFHGNGLTVNRNVFEKVGLFDTSLELSQDTHMWIKLSSMCKLLPGNLSQAVAKRGVHRANRVQNKMKLYYFRPILFWNLQEWAKSKLLDKKHITILSFFYIIWLFRYSAKLPFKETLSLIYNSRNQLLYAFRSIKTFTLFTFLIRRM